MEKFWGIEHGAHWLPAISFAAIPIHVPAYPCHPFDPWFRNLKSFVPRHNPLISHALGFSGTVSFRSNGLIG